MNKSIQLFIIAFISLAIAGISCSKSSPTPPPANPCASKTIVVTATVMPASNATAANGSIDATASGSTSFTYSKDGSTFQASGTFSNLGVGNYTITAKDADGCTGTKAVTVTSVPCPTITLTATLTQATTPTSADGSITVTAAGSTGFTYSKDGVAFQAGNVFNNLTVGSYTITAKDGNGCTGSAGFSVTAVSCPTITLTATPTNATGPTATNGSIAASATGGATPHTFSKNGGTTFQATGTFTSLAVGTYQIVAKDANGCLSNVSNVTISSTCPTLTASGVSTGSDKCANNTGTITITAGGSTGFTYNLNNGAYQASNLFSQLANGSYTIGVKDANGCTTTSTASVAIAPAGSLFSAVKAVLATNCAVPGCHSLPAPQNGLNFADDCTIVAQKDRIKARAVDANPSQMPPSGPVLSATDKQKIVDWINAGGKHSN